MAGNFVECTSCRVSIEQHQNFRDRRTIFFRVDRIGEFFSNSSRLENYILQYLFMREEEEEKLFVGASALLPSHRGRLPVFLASPATWARYWFYFILFFILINEWMNAVVIAGMKQKRWSSTSTQWLGFNRIDQRWFIDIAFSLILWAYNFTYRLHLHWNQSKNCF